MDAKRAFDILVQATGQINANRETHVAIQQALDVVRQALNGQITEAQPETQQAAEPVIDTATEN
jgi:hypothetical protein